MISLDIETAQLTNANHSGPNPAWSYSAHAHTSWEFVCFVRGTGRIDMPNTTLRPHPYQLVVYPPGLIHAESSDPTDPRETIAFRADIQGEFAPGIHLLVPDPDGELGWLCERIVKEFYVEFRASGVTPLEFRASESMPLLNHYVCTFLYVFQKLCNSGVAVQHGALDMAVQYLHSNYSKDITLQALAKFVCVSQSSLSHLFTARFGISPLRYLHKIRMENAKRLLSTTSLHVNEISAQVGFTDPFYFSRAFKCATGLSPSEYRIQTNSTI